MIIADLHTHSAFSSDSESSPKSMIDKAIELGLKYYCFTDHKNPDIELYQPDAPEFILDTPAYRDCIAQLKDEYKGKIEVLWGVEIGLTPKKAKEIDKYVSDYDFDFVIGSSHMVGDRDPYRPGYFDGRPEQVAIREYLESILDNSKSTESFDVYGHLDYVLRYGPTKSKEFKPESHTKLMADVFDLLISRGQGIEINTAGLRGGLPFIHPNYTFFKLYKDMGGEIVTVGTDSHVPDTIAFGFKEAEELLRSVGFDYYCIFKNRKPEFIKL